MAAAEARAAWQRTANRYFVQEDAKRAPKLAYCQSSNPSSKQVDTGPTAFADGPSHPAVGFGPSNRAPPYSNLPSDLKWWLQMQPNYRVLNSDQVNTKPSNVGSPPSMGSQVVDDTNTNTNTIMGEESIRSIEFEDLESILDGKKHPDLHLEELGAGDGKVDQDLVDLNNLTDYYEFLEMEMVGGLGSKRASEFSSNADSSWMGGEKVPWWRVTDEEELASFVAHKSLHHVENCDLPPPQKVHVRSEVCKRAMSRDHDEMVVCSKGLEALSDGISVRSSGSSLSRQWSPNKEGVSHDENSGSRALRSKTAKLEEGRLSSTDPSKAQLLEALCHSQTRAREAEEAAKQAYTEKEDLLKLFFRQASQLFAYKQWFKMLQLEALLQQTKGIDPSHLTPFPGLLPWMPLKNQKFCRSCPKSSKAKRSKRGKRGNGNDMGKFAAAFALGFTLVGAGLILGWTVGWLLPAF